MLRSSHPGGFPRARSSHKCRDLSHHNCTEPPSLSALPAEVPPEVFANLHVVCGDVVHAAIPSPRCREQSRTRAKQAHLPGIAPHPRGIFRTRSTWSSDEAATSEVNLVHSTQDRAERDARNGDVGSVVHMQTVGRSRSINQIRTALFPSPLCFVVVLLLGHPHSQPYS